MDLRQNTAVRIAVGPFVDTDGVPQTSLDVTTIAVQLLQEDDDGTGVNRTAFSPTASDGNNDMVHITSDTAGFYDLELTAAQTNFVGRLTLTAFVSGSLVVTQTYSLLPQDVYDAKYAGDFVSLTAIVDGIGERTVTPPTGAPDFSSTNVDWDTAIAWLMQLAANAVKHNRNTGELEAYDAAGSKIAEAPVSDSGGATGTLTRDKWGSSD